jgi:hypothetical protein
VKTGWPNLRQISQNLLRKAMAKKTAVFSMMMMIIIIYKGVNTIMETLRNRGTELICVGYIE